MKNIKPFKPNERQAKQWLKEAATPDKEGADPKKRRRLVFSEHAEIQMRKRKIGRRQVLETLMHGTMSEPLHQDIHGDWKCSISWRHAGLQVTVAAAFKLHESGNWIVIITVF